MSTDVFEMHLSQSKNTKTHTVARSYPLACLHALLKQCIKVANDAYVANVFSGARSPSILLPFRIPFLDTCTTDGVRIPSAGRYHNLHLMLYVESVLIKIPNSPFGVVSNTRTNACTKSSPRRQQEDGYPTHDQFRTVIRLVAWASFCNVPTCPVTARYFT